MKKIINSKFVIVILINITILISCNYYSQGVFNIRDDDIVIKDFKDNFNKFQIVVDGLNSENDYYFFFDFNSNYIRRFHQDGLKIANWEDRENTEYGKVIMDNVKNIIYEHEYTSIAKDKNWIVFLRSNKDAQQGVYYRLSDNKNDKLNSGSLLINKEIFKNWYYFRKLK